MNTILRQNPGLADELKVAVEADPKMAESGHRQLSFIYERSVYKEKEHMRYPIFRLVND